MRLTTFSDDTLRVLIYLAGASGPARDHRRNRGAVRAMPDLMRHPLRLDKSFIVSYLIWHLGRRLKVRQMHHKDTKNTKSQATSAYTHEPRSS